MIPGYAFKDVFYYGLLYLSNQSGTALFIISMILICAAGYLLGSINTAIILSKKVYGKDIRECGSGNAGMTNVLRTYGKKAAIITVLGDVGKTGLACLLGALVWGQTGAFLAGFASIIGHMWPVWFKFKGGKGVLSFASVLLFCAPKVFLVCFTIFFIIVAFSKYISLGSVSCALIMPIILARFIGAQTLILIPAIIIALIIVWKHRSNIKRLREGKENKIHLGKDGGFLPKWILIVICLVLTAASVLAIVFTFRTEYAVTYKKDRMTSAYLRIIFVTEKNEYFKNEPQNDEHDEEIMQTAINKAKRILVTKDAAASDNRAISDEGRNAAINYFKDVSSLYGSVEGDTAETYCHRIYGYDISPNDIVKVQAALIFADEYRQAVTEQKADRLLSEAEENIKVSDKIKQAIINNY
ncbi:MAG: glycerol-3-phosphate 1-O-acyltransferase PlsY [Clostridia bacterium]|nr:glycerol-3-phosphate 1-O-acyltransferase PlsY [Clostridia bacterium]